MQPTYLPWLGYFDLMDQADVFVFLDNVQFARRSWQQRNRIRGPKGLQWLSVPVKKRGRYHRDIRSTKIVKDGRFPTKHLRALEYSYKGAPHFKDYFPGIRDILMAREALRSYGRAEGRARCCDAGLRSRQRTLDAASR